MNPEIKEKWLAALRSGEYKKGFSYLRAKEKNGGHSYCCLGVLCDLHNKETGEGNWKEGEDERYEIDHEDTSTQYLPKRVQEWSGIDGIGRFEFRDYDDVLSYIAANNSTTLVSINDRVLGTPGHDLTFNTIIEYIEKYF